jgi:proton glutamate symport protein
MPKIPLHWQIAIGMILGSTLGIISNLAGWELMALQNFSGFVGDLFIRGLRFVAVPIVLFSLIVGAGGLGDIKKLGGIGLKTFLLHYRHIHLLGTSSRECTCTRDRSLSRAAGGSD